MVLYSHQGVCEHAVIVSDVRLLHARDVLARSAYPRTVFQASLCRRLHCSVCKRLNARWLLLGHPETPEDVCVLCRLCVGLFDVDAHHAASARLMELEAEQEA
jgi:snRNA-activating protein complex subunit 3